MAGTDWAGTKLSKHRQRFADTIPWPQQCAICGTTLTRQDNWVAGHILPRSTHPQLTWDLANLRVECRPCSDSQGGRDSQAKRRAARRNRTTNTQRDGAVPLGDESPRVPTAPDKSIPPGVSHEPVGMPPMHPDGYPMPRIETEPRPNTDHTLADEVLAWIDDNAPGEPLLPWQRHVVRRGFETADGHLWRHVVFVVPRQQGKTYLMQRVLLARVSMVAAFGPSSVLNTAPDVRQANELLEVLGRQMRAGYLRAMANGSDWWFDSPDVHGMGQGRVWRARAMTRAAITGQGGVGMVFVDELQDARREVFNRSIRPVLSGARVRFPQVWLSGTGERDGSDVMRDLRRASLLPEPDVLWLEWSAPPGCALTDEAAWRWATPDWSESRLLSMRADARSMPERDFRSEYLVSHESQITAWLDPDAVRCRAVPSVRVPSGSVAAVEVSLDGRWWSAAVSDGSVVALCPPGPFDRVQRFLREHRPVRVVAHGALASQLEADRWPLHRPSAADWSAAVSVFDQAVRAGAVVWDHGDEMTRQVLDVVLVSAEGGPRIAPSKSRGDVSLVKAAASALWLAGRATREPVLVI